MDLREAGKFAAAMVGTLLYVAFVDWISAKVFQIKYLERPAYEVPGVSAPEVDLAALRRQWPQALDSPSDRAVLLGYMRNMPKEIGSNLTPEGALPVAAAMEEVPDLATAIPAASPAAGEQVAKRCMQCHDWTKNGPNKIGPNLYGIIGRKRASHEGFSYSTAMKGKGGTWTYEEIFRYLRSPASYIPGNKMPFAGLPHVQDRLNLIAYMRSWADKPPALPPPKQPGPTLDDHAKPIKAVPQKSAPKA